jgi:hypothetical protein
MESFSRQDRVDAKMREIDELAVELEVAMWHIGVATDKLRDVGNALNAAKFDAAALLFRAKDLEDTREARGDQPMR